MPTAAVRCVYDGAEWQYAHWDDDYELAPWFKEFGDVDAFEWRLSDCYTTERVPPHLIEVQDKEHGWRPVSSGRRAGFCASSLTKDTR